MGNKTFGNTNLYSHGTCSDTVFRCISKFYIYIYKHGADLIFLSLKVVYVKYRINNLNFIEILKLQFKITILSYKERKTYFYTAK